MHRHLFIASLLLTSGCATKIPSYAEAAENAEAMKENALVKKWSEKVGAPFFDRNLEPILLKCVQLVPESTSVTAHLVIDAKGSPPPTQIADSDPTPFSECLRRELQGLAWPKAPTAARFLPLEINAHNSGSEGRAADDVIISITPSNNSFERTREE